jgi:hypothetical protein
LIGLILVLNLRRKAEFVAVLLEMEIHGDSVRKWHFNHAPHALSG